jgi:hypothetical protein
MLNCSGRSLPNAIADAAGDPHKSTPHQLGRLCLIWRCCGVHVADPESNPETSEVGGLTAQIMWG